MFFSIFATVFGGQGDAATARIRVAVVDEDQSEFSRRLVDGLKKEKWLAGAGRRPTTKARGAGARSAGGRAAGAERRRAGGDRHARADSARRSGNPASAAVPPIRAARRSVSDPIAPQMVGGLLQKVTMTAAPDLMMQGGMRQFETLRGRAHAAAACGRGCVDPAVEARRRAGRGSGDGGDGRRPSTSSTSCARTTSAARSSRSTPPASA